MVGGAVAKAVWINTREQQLLLASKNRNPERLLQVLAHIL